MGYDLVAKERKHGAAGYYSANIRYMPFLRSAMVAAGVPEALVYKKFTGNDNLLVTARQSEMIARRLLVWLRGRDLVVDVVESHDSARASLDALLRVQRALGMRKEAARLAKRRATKSPPVRLDRESRAELREFVRFCAGSGGFYVG